MTLSLEEKFDRTHEVRAALERTVGASPDPVDRSCHDCGVLPGEAHPNGCDVARCLWDGGQQIQCSGSLASQVCRILREHGHDDLAEDVADYLDLEDDDHDCGEDIWTGTWPGVLECREYGFWCTDPRHPPMRPCPPDTPGASEDLNRLFRECHWDRQQQKWVQ